MSLEEINDAVIFIGYAVFLFLAISIFIKFKKMNLELIRARMFLKKNILIKNLNYILVAGTFLAIHEFIHIAIVKGFLPISYDPLSETMETLSLIFLIMWMYNWQIMLKH